MSTTSAEQNKALVLKAFDTLFNKRDYAAAEGFWSETYIQHSAHIPPGRDGLFNLVRGLPETLRYDNHVILADGDYVIAHGRFSGHGRPRSWIATGIVRFEDGKLAEDWDVLQDEATQAESLSGPPDAWRPFPGLSVAHGKYKLVSKRGRLIPQKHAKPGGVKNERDLPIHRGHATGKVLGSEKTPQGPWSRPGAHSR